MELSFSPGWPPQSHVAVTRRAGHPAPAFVWGEHGTNHMIAVWEGRGGEDQPSIRNPIGPEPTWHIPAEASPTGHDGTILVHPNWRSIPTIHDGAILYILIGDPTCPQCVHNGAILVYPKWKPNPLAMMKPTWYIPSKDSPHWPNWNQFGSVQLGNPTIYHDGGKLVHPN